MRRVATLLGRTGELCLLVGLAAIGLATELVAGDGRWWADLLVGLAVGFTGVLVVGHRTRDPVGWLRTAWPTSRRGRSKCSRWSLRGPVLRLG